MNKQKRRIAFLLIVFLFIQGGPMPVRAADMQFRVNVEVFVDGMEAGAIPAFDDDYENNLYASLKGFAYVLRGTGKAFTPVVEKQKITIETGAGYSLKPSLWDAKALSSTSTATPSKYEMSVDGAERKYYSFIFSRDGSYDAFMTPLSLALLFDLEVEVSRDRIDIRTTVPFSLSAEEMEESGYLQGVNSLVIGDGTTGEIYYRFDGEKAFPIASTTKLMTYFVLMDAVAAGECGLEDTVVVSERAARLSKSMDGVLPMKAGSRIPMSDLLYGMLLPSSNECALVIAEHVAGSQEAFVERMNEKAEELGLSEARFYNCHGLPSYDNQLVPAKMQNHMTAEEMFRMVSALLDAYPQVTEYTSTVKYHLGAFNRDVKNTNAVLYNMDNVIGLKTGTTNKAGACLVTCVAAEKDGMPHRLITVLFGAEGDADRGIVSEVSARYARRTLMEKTEGDDPGEGGRKIPADPEMVVRELIKRMK